MLKRYIPKVHGGILGRRGIDDEVMAQHQIDPIDMVVVNLYPFAQTVARADCTLELAVENIDIGVGRQWFVPPRKIIKMWQLW